VCRGYTYDLAPTNLRMLLIVKVKSNFSRQGEADTFSHAGVLMRQNTTRHEHISTAATICL
jgi:hypothetical protein